MGTSDFSGRLPDHLGAAGEPVDVVSIRATSVAPDLTQREANAEVAQRLRELHAARHADDPAPPPPRPPLPTPAESEQALTAARDGLRQAIVKRDAAQSTADAAESALARGRAAADAVREQLRGLGNPDATIAAFLAGQATKGRSGHLPDDLRRRRDERTRLLQEADDAGHAVAVLEQNAEAAKARLSTAQAVVRDRVRSVLAIHAEALAVEVLHEQCATFQKKRKLIAAVDSGALGSSRDWPAGISDAIHSNPEYAANISPREHSTLMQAWQTVADALQSDPDADHDLHIAG